MVSAVMEIPIYDLKPGAWFGGLLRLKSELCTLSVYVLLLRSIAACCETGRLGLEMRKVASLTNFAIQFIQVQCSK